MALEKCETCGTEIQPGTCMVCGANPCCHWCCAEDTKALLEIRANPNNAVLLEALKPIPVNTEGSLWDCEDCYPKLCHCRGANA